MWCCSGPFWSVPLTFLSTAIYRAPSICPFVQLVSLLMPRLISGALAQSFLSWLGVTSANPWSACHRLQRSHPLHTLLPSTRALLSARNLQAMNIPRQTSTNSLSDDVPASHFSPMCA